ncbi:hypothetical protein MTO96_008356 [Rhipicephalus appendiculatus]
MAKEGHCPLADPGVTYSVTVFAYLGLFFAVYLLCRILYALWQGFYTCYLARWLGHNINLRKMGEWAVVTGASDGIGKAYCEELAARGLNIVLISRTLEKLEAVAHDIEEASNVKTKVIAVDFTSSGDIYSTIRRELQGLEIGVLAQFLMVTRSWRVSSGPNCVAATMMTRIVLPQMDERRRGVIINVSSISAMHPLPLLSAYAASKAYLDNLSQGLHAEYKDRGIFIQSVMPAYVSTKMSKIRKATYMVPTATTYVREALNTCWCRARHLRLWSHTRSGLWSSGSSWSACPTTHS